MNGFETDAVVIGAGVVGLAVARQLSLSGHDVVLLEKNEHFGMETSARNSEVIHAGIYYPAGLAEGETVHPVARHYCTIFARRMACRTGASEN